ncbi:MAG: hypothetical protein KDD31_08860 [Muricauda sp.]|nr:hypothetical protein [Allomuricauda sp.]
MKNYFVLLYLIFLPISCGIIEETEEEKVTYTYIIKNKTGSDLQIESDFGRIELITNDGAFQCETIANVGYIGGLCSGTLEIRIPNTNLGYQCFGLGLEPKGLCFTEDNRLFLISDTTIFTEVGTRTYEYVLTPELLENVFELPD